MPLQRQGNSLRIIHPTVQSFHLLTWRHRIPFPVSLKSLVSGQGSLFHAIYLYLGSCHKGLSSAVLCDSYGGMGVTPALHLHI